MDDATTTLSKAVTASVEALWTFGPPSAYAGVDPDSERVVAYALATAGKPTASVAPCSADGWSR